MLVLVCVLVLGSKTDDIALDNDQVAVDKRLLLRIIETLWAIAPKLIRSWHEDVEHEHAHEHEHGWL